MGLYLEYRDRQGVVRNRSRFFDGLVTWTLDCPDEERWTHERVRELVRPSAHLPIEQREWALRVVPDEWDDGEWRRTS
jgi:hypothetical protein